MFEDLDLEVKENRSSFHRGDDSNDDDDDDDYDSINHSSAADIRSMSDDKSFNHSSDNQSIVSAHLEDVRPVNDLAFNDCSCSNEDVIIESGLVNISDNVKGFYASTNLEDFRSTSSLVSDIKDKNHFHKSELPVTIRPKSLGENCSDDQKHIQSSESIVEGKTGSNLACNFTNHSNESEHLNSIRHSSINSFNLGHTGGYFSHKDTLGQGSLIKKLDFDSNNKKTGQEENGKSGKISSNGR